MATIDPTVTPHFAVAGSFLEALAARDFDRLATTLDDDATLSALLPRGFDEWNGADAIAAAFARWFGSATSFEVADASVGQVGPRLQLRWRVRVLDPSRGEGRMVVEQNVYAETTSEGRIAGMALLCSGFCPETPDA
ncbi:MAG: nuclear transport factor 2 family protein [Acidimicrobiia bacterium]